MHVFGADNSDLQLIPKIITHFRIMTLVDKNVTFQTKKGMT